MLSIKTLSENLKKKTLSTNLNAIIQSCPTPLTTLSSFPDTGSFVAFMESAVLCSIERDRGLADLIRLVRLKPSQPIFDILLYVFIPSVRRISHRIQASTSQEMDEIISDVLATALEVIPNYDPDHRSIHIQANIELDIFNVFHRRWEKEKQTNQAISAISSLLWDSSPLANPEHITSFPGIPDHSEIRLNDKDKRLGEQVLREIADRGLMSELDCELMIAFCLKGQTSTAIGCQHDIDRRTVVRRIQRTRNLIKHYLFELFFSDQRPFCHAADCKGVKGAKNAE